MRSKYEAQLLNSFDFLKDLLNFVQHFYALPLLNSWCFYRVGHLFFSKERSDLYVLFRSLEKNVPIFAFFSILYKRTFRSLRSFLFFIKERSDLCVLFRFF